MKHVTIMLALALCASRSALADAPAGRYTVSGGVVTDNVTGRKWQQAVLSQNPTLTWTVGTSYCDNLSLGGSSAWRLPTVKELQSIIDETKVYPSIDATAFPDAQYAFWSATTAADDATKAWMVDYSLGFNYPGTKTNGNGPRVRCVR